MPVQAANLIAVDIGNSRTKLGWFHRPRECSDATLAGVLPIAGAALPEPAETLSLSPPFGGDSAAAGRLREWLETHAISPSAIAIASVNRPAEEALTEMLNAEPAAADTRVVQLTNAGLPIKTSVQEPSRVGADRLLGAIAANRLRRAEHAAIVVDLGTAITVDLVAPDGSFQGGAILPGIAMSARALAEQTDALPVSPLAELDSSPDAVGQSTDAAIEAGLFWGAVGAVREIIERQSDRLREPPQVFLTGGAAPSVARLLGGPDRTVRYLPDLVLSGIALAVEHQGAGG